MILVEAVFAAALFYSTVGIDHPDENFVAAIALGLLIAGIGFGILFAPGKVWFAAARGMAVTGCIGVLGVIGLFFVASSFENGGGNDQSSFLLLLIGGLILQLMIWGLTIPASGDSIGEALGSSAVGAFGFWAVSIVIALGAGMLTRLR